jgi:hypothetical protein
VAQVWDHDPLTSDDYLGTALIPLPPPPKEHDDEEEEEEEDEDGDMIDVTPRAAARPATAVVTAAGGASPRAAVSLAAAALHTPSDAVAVTESASADDDSAMMRQRTKAAAAASASKLASGSYASLPPRTGRGVSEGWYPLEAAAQHAAALRDTLRRLGRAGDASPSAAAPPFGIPRGALGEVAVRVSWGDGVARRGAAAAATAALLRPTAHRESIGTLTVRVLQARALPPPRHEGCAPAVLLRCERQRGATRRAARAASDVSWCGGDGDGGDADAAAALATFSFDVTEITSEVTFTVQHRGGEAEEAAGGGDTPQRKPARRQPRATTIGEVCLPLPVLLAHDAASGLRAALLRGGRAGSVVAAPPRWARILPARARGDPFFRERTTTDDDDDDGGMAAAPLGLLRYEARLTLRHSVAWCYTVPEVRAGGVYLRGHGIRVLALNTDACAQVLPPAPPSLSPPPRRRQHTAAAARSAAVRLASAALLAAVSPLRAALYLQSFQAPLLNAALLTTLTLLCFHARAAVAPATWPLWAALSVVLIGCAPPAGAPASFAFGVAAMRLSHSRALFSHRAAAPLRCLLRFVEYLIDKDGGGGDGGGGATSEEDAAADADADADAAVPAGAARLTAATALPRRAGEEASQAAAAQRQGGSGTATEDAAAAAEAENNDDDDNAAEDEEARERRFLWDAYRRDKPRLARFAAAAHAASARLECCGAALTWQADPSLSALFAALLLLCAASLSAALAALRVAGFGAHHAAFALGVAAVAPAPALTRAALDAIDAAALRATPLRLRRSLAAGAGLRRTTPPGAPRAEAPPEARRAAYERQAAEQARAAVCIVVRCGVPFDARARSDALCAPWRSCAGGARSRTRRRRCERRRCGVIIGIGIIIAARRAAAAAGGGAAAPAGARAGRGARRAPAHRAPRAAARAAGGGGGGGALNASKKGKGCARAARKRARLAAREAALAACRAPGTRPQMRPARA